MGVFSVWAPDIAATCTAKNQPPSNVWAKDILQRDPRPHLCTAHYIPSTELKDKTGRNQDWNDPKAMTIRKSLGMIPIITVMDRKWQKHHGEHRLFLQHHLGWWTVQRASLTLWVSFRTVDLKPLWRFHQFKAFTFHTLLRNKTCVTWIKKGTSEANHSICQVYMIYHLL